MHTIRLRRPWTRVVGDAGPAEKVDAPDPGATVAGRVEYRRRFNLPTGLTDDERVRLAVEHLSGREASIHLNGQPVFEGELREDDFPLVVDLNEHLEAANELSVRLTGNEQTPARLDGSVQLQIEG
jgi:hypothetical protein